MALETQVEIRESVRGKDVFIVQTGHSGSDDGSVNDAIMEMLITCYATKTSSARKVIGKWWSILVVCFLIKSHMNFTPYSFIVGVIPYLPYSKQSMMRKRGCITAKLLATMMARAGMSHLITMDLYTKEIQGFFDFPVDNLRGSPFLIQYIKENVRLINQ